MRRLKDHVVEKRAEIFFKRLLEIHGSSIKIVSQYRTMNGEIDVECSRHGVFKTTPKRLVHRGQGCPECGLENRIKNTTETRRLQQFDRALATAAANGWKVATKRENYKTTGGKLEFMCDCGYSWQQTAKVAANAKRCRRCANIEANKTRSVPLEKRLAAIQFVHDDSIVVMAHNGVMGKFECKVCSNVWKTKLALVAGGSGCKVCAMKRVMVAPKRIQYQIELCGKTEYIVGYEAHAIRWILKNKRIPESAINLSPPIFTYTENEKTRRYIPDFQIGKNIVEVKSLATAGLQIGTKFASFSNLKRKARSVKRAGYKFILMIMDGATRIPVPSNWDQLTRKELMSIVHSSSGT